ncbi:MAG TPA: DMT family transporter [Desulfatiglandales bacterium]|nr:DMT family transporter [Desulfatiglandales bacterium]
MHKPTEFLADLSLLFVAIIWGSTFIIVKQSVENIPVFSFLFMRFALAGMLLILINAPKLKAIDKGVLSDGVMLGIALFLAYAFQTFALTATSASITAFITGLFVVFVPVLSSVFLRKLPRQEAMIGVVFATIGLAFITLQGKFLVSFGEFLALVCAFFIAIHIILTDKLSRRNDFGLLTLVQVNIVALFSLIFSLFLDPRVIPIQFNNQLIFSLIINSVFATFVAFVIQTSMQKYTTPTKAAIIFIMEPVSSAFFSYWIGGELLTAKQYVGTSFILLAMVFTEAGTYLKMKREATFG